MINIKLSYNNNNKNILNIISQIKTRESCTLNTSYKFCAYLQYYQIVHQNTEKKNNSWFYDFIFTLDNMNISLEQNVTMPNTFVVFLEYSWSSLHISESAFFLKHWFYVAYIYRLSSPIIETLILPSCFSSPEHRLTFAVQIACRLKQDC